MIFNSETKKIIFFISYSGEYLKYCIVKCGSGKYICCLDCIKSCKECEFIKHINNFMPEHDCEYCVLEERKLILYLLTGDL